MIINNKNSQKLKLKEIRVENSKKRVLMLELTVIMNDLSKK